MRMAAAARSTTRPAPPPWPFGHLATAASVAKAAEHRATTAAKPRPIAFDDVFKNMDYNGGPIMPSNTDEC